MQEGSIEQIGTPREVYEAPQTLNVAKFIGEVNIFDGEIVRMDGKQLLIDLFGKLRPAKAVEKQNRLQYIVGEKVHLLIRPEDVRVWNQHEVDAATTAEMFAGTVEEVIYKGTTVDLMVRLNNTFYHNASPVVISATEFFDEDDERLEYKIGEQVWVSWAPGWEVILPYEA
jgi:spermidine/putrescine transport system ATP-binding protein